MKPIDRQRGFTLVEVLVALMVFALCASVLSGQSSATLRNRQLLIDKQLAQWVAQDYLARHQLARWQRSSLPAVSGHNSSNSVSEQLTMAGAGWLITQHIKEDTLNPGGKNKARRADDSVAGVKSAVITVSRVDQPDVVLVRLNYWRSVE